MDSNWWLLRGLLSRPVMRFGGGIVGVAVLYVMFFGPFEDWTKQTIQDRAATIAEWRTERVREAFDLPSPSPSPGETTMFSIPTTDARGVVRQVRVAGYDVSVRSRQGPRWRIVVRDLPPPDVDIVERIVREVSPGARTLP